MRRASKPGRTPKTRSGEVGTGQDEDAALRATYDPSAYPRPSVAVDVAVITLKGERLHALLVPRAAPPFRGRLALPGAFVRLDESLDAAARRVLTEKAGLSGVFVEQLYTFGAIDRDPRMRVITVAYVALVANERLAEDDGHRFHPVEIPWEGETGGPVEVAAGELAFDHAGILGKAIQRLRGKLDYTPIGFQLLPDEFTLRDLLRVHEVVLGRPLNKDSFRRRMLASGDLVATGTQEASVDHRPAELYRFARRSAV
jgi:8-oxo-dGTP diphosphatase